MKNMWNMTIKRAINFHSFSNSSSIFVFHLIRKRAFKKVNNCNVKKTDTNQSQCFQKNTPVKKQQIASALTFTICPALKLSYLSAHVNQSRKLAKTRTWLAWINLLRKNSETLTPQMKTHLLNINFTDPSKNHTSNCKVDFHCKTVNITDCL